MPGQTVTNTGTIAADGGTVTLTAAAARNIVDSLVSNSGIIQANAVGQQGGTVILYAEGSNAVKGNVTANKGKKAGSSLVVNSGTITASGYDSGQKGGKITITGDNVGILSGSFIDASGDIGGGTIKIGGDFHGGGSTPTALNTYVDANSLIMANANISGNGGNVTVWSDGNTWFGGNILAEGGKNSGNGGFVETSGKQTLSMQGIVDASAPKGTAGTWLMDPNNLVINGIATSNAGSTPNWTAASGGGNVLNTDIDAALNGGTSVDLTASGSITFASNISKSSGGDATLTAAAGTDIIVNSNIGSTVGKLNVVFDSDTASGGGAIYMNTGSSITSNGGNITLGGGALSGGLPTGAAVGDAYSNIGIISGQLQAGGGNISLSGDGYTNTDNPYVVGVYIYTKVQTTGSGTISITGVGGSNLAEPDTYFDHGVELYGALVSTANGNITIHGTAPLYFGLLIQGGGEVQSTGTGNITLYGNTMGVGEGAYLAGGSTVSTNSGNITITGIGANYNGGPNIGIILDGWGGGSPGTVESMSGNLTMNGTGGSATGTANWGIYSGGGTIETGGAGTISLNGTGGTGGSADYGVYLGSGTTVHTLNGALTITGIGGETNMAGIYTTGGSNVIGGGSETGNITLTADKVSLANLSVQTTGNITAKEYTANTTIDIGTNAVGSLNWTDAELGFLNGGSYTFGDSSAGNLDINTAVTFANPVTFQSGGNITLDHALVSSASGNAITLASGENVINDVGASPLTPGTGRYLIYSTNPANNTLDGLSDAGDHVFNKTYGGYAPGSVTQPGNLFLYSLSPTITVTANNASRLYGAGDPSFTASYSGFIDNDTSSILSGSPSLTTPGGDTATSAAGSTYTITAAVGSLAQSLGYQFSYAPGTLTVNKAHLTVTADNQSRLYGAADPSFTDTISGFANGQNLGTSGVSGSAANSTPGGDTSASAAGSTYAITPTLGTLSASNYDFTTFNTGTLTVGKAHLTVTADNQSRLYGAADPSFTDTISGFANGQNLGTSGVSGSASNTTPGGDTSASAAGSTYAITPTQGTLSASNYDFTTFNAGTLTVNKAHLTVTADNQSRLYGAADPSFTDTISGFANGQNLGTSGVSGSASNSTPGTDIATSAAGSTYAITATQGTLAASNYDFTTFTAGTLTVNKAHLTVTADNQGRLYGAADPSFTDTLSGFANGQNLGTSGVSGSASNSTPGGDTSASAAGSTYAITPTLGSLSASNYDFTTFNTGTLTVGKAHLTVTADNQSRLYGAADPSFTDTISGFANGQNLGTSGVSGSASNSTPGTDIATSAAGSTYAITPTQGLLSASNYDFTTFTAGTLTVNKAHLTVTADDQSRLYGAADPVFTDTISGFANGQNLGTSGVLGSASNTTPGGDTSASAAGSTYAITPTQGTLSASNYDFTTFNAGTLTVNKAHLTVTADNQSRLYGAADPSFTDTISGFANGQNSSVVSGSAANTTPGGDTSASAAGSTYAITPTLGTLAASNYDFTTFTAGTLTVGNSTLPSQVEAVIDLRTPIGELRELSSSGYMASPLLVAAPIYIEAGLFNSLGLNESDAYHWWAGVVPTTMQSQP